MKHTKDMVFLYSIFGFVLVVAAVFLITNANNIQIAANVVYEELDTAQSYLTYCADRKSPDCVRCDISQEKLEQFTSEVAKGTLTVQDTARILQTAKYHRDACAE